MYYLKSIICLLILSFFLFNSCDRQKHFITDPAYRRTVEADFKKAKQLAKERDKELFSVFDNNLSPEQTEALKFLYAYMPTNDLADYDGDFFLSNVNLAFAARDSFSWGNSAPEHVFRHFVLPYRVNNEDLDSSRKIFLYELYPRIKDMTIEQAALEVNHWCHEKISYQPTDSRTICPLGVIKTGYGRCGEESTFTVTAMRSVGIPARQVYTPRWAHVDDNHAWVEVYIDGTWKYLGACEPEPVLNKGWFSAPAKRAMMVHTRVFGKYNGDEDIIDQKEKYTTLNVLKNYAPVKEIWVKVVDSLNNPLEGAWVEFGLYNYAEFYPLNKVPTSKDGMAYLKTGLGDLRIFASDKKSHFFVKKISVAETDTLIAKLDRQVGESYSLTNEYTPPVEKVLEEVSEDGMKENQIRFEQEDSIRSAYISTFYTKEKSDEMSEELSADTDKEKVWKFMQESRGNYPEIENYLRKTYPEYKQTSLDLLDEIAEKDFHDITSTVLENHLHSFTVFKNANYSKDIVKDYILNPRVYLEQISSYRSFLQNKFNDSVKQDIEGTVLSLLDWIVKNIAIDNEGSYYAVQSTPVGTYELKVCHEFGRRIFFVALCRSLGIAARLEPVTLKVQYYTDKWVNVTFEENTLPETPEMAELSLMTDKNQIVDPLYRVHFGIAGYKDGKFTTLDYEWLKPLSSFAEKLEIEPGYYQVITGNRMEDGTVLTHCQFIEIKKDGNNAVLIRMNDDLKKIEPVARLKGFTSKQKVTVLGWLDPDTEPGNHFLNDFQMVKSTFESLNVPVTIYCNSEEQKQKISGFVTKNINVEFEQGTERLKDIYAKSNLSQKINLPVFIIIDADGNIYYHSTGYNIGTSEQILKIFKRLTSRT